MLQHNVSEPIAQQNIPKSLTAMSKIYKAFQNR